MARGLEPPAVAPVEPEGPAVPINIYIYMMLYVRYVCVLHVRELRGVLTAVLWPHAPISACDVRGSTGTVAESASANHRREWLLPRRRHNPSGEWVGGGRVGGGWWVVSGPAPPLPVLISASLPPEPLRSCRVHDHKNSKSLQGRTELKRSTCARIYIYIYTYVYTYS